MVNAKHFNEFLGRVEGKLFEIFDTTMSELLVSNLALKTHFLNQEITCGTTEIIPEKYPVREKTPRREIEKV